MSRRKIIINTILMLFVTSIANAKGVKLETFCGVDSLASTHYIVELKQGERVERSFVYEDINKFSEQEYSISESNNWTNFCFEGEVRVEITPIGGVRGEYELRPTAKGVDYVVEDGKICFTLTRPEKLYLWSEENPNNPLFIFANEMQKRPDTTDPNVVYWGDGVHNIGKHYPLESGKTYYIDGGAYLIGSFLSEHNGHDIKVCGLGILSGEQIEHGPYKTHKFDRLALRFQGHRQSGLVVEGITIINPGQYCIQAYGSQLHTSNVKCFGWWFETDGWVGGDGSTLKDSFFKVYDDIVKIYFNDLRVENLTIYKQHNGAVFQFGWSHERSSNAKIGDIYVVRDDTRWNQKELEGNRGFLNTATGSERNEVSNIKISNVHYDDDISYLIGINSRGTYRGITIKDMWVRGEQRFKSYLSGGKISDIVFENVSISGKVIDCDKDIDLHVNGEIHPILYK